jgi:hypothetical protein
MAIGIEPHVNLTVDAPETWEASVEGWSALGAGHFFASTMGGGYRRVEQHLRRLEMFRAAMGGRF